jgi:CxxC motif-containing protein
MRIFTSSVRVIGADSPLVPVRSRSPIPKGLLLQCVEELRGLELKAPVGLYDIVVPNILNTSVDIITTTAVDTSEK